MRLRNGKKTISESPHHLQNSTAVAKLEGNSTKGFVQRTDQEEEYQSGNLEQPEIQNVMSAGDKKISKEVDSRNTLISSTSNRFGLSCCYRVVGYTIISATVFLLVFFLVAAPAIIKLVPSLPKHIVYLNAFKIPYHVDLAVPASVGLKYAQNFYLTTDSDISVGIWHVLPKSLEKSDLQSEEFISLLSSKVPIILYCHGNTGTRGTEHRVKLYKVLASEDYHVIALDYRGYGDSTGTPTSENGVVHDVMFVYKWLKEKSGKDTPIFVWGHSLGTGIATKAVDQLCNDNDSDCPTGLILEAPFNNAYEAAMHHPFSLPFRKLWWFDDVFLQGMHDLGIYFQSDEHIRHIDLPILILHAEDDKIVPYYLGQKLFEACQSKPRKHKPIFHTFKAELGYQHKWICSAPDLPDILKQFRQSV